MARLLPELQEDALRRADDYCSRYVKPRRRSSRKGATTDAEDTPARQTHTRPGPFYQPRDHEASPFFQVVRGYLAEFERVYPERYQKAYGYA